MRSFLYPKLAVTNVKKNSKTYIPYLLTGTLTVAMYYIINSIVYNEGIREMPGADSLIQIIGMGTVIVALFSCIFLFYTNSFLMKQRKKELGLYNVLGMGKRHIAKMMIFETLMTAVFDIIAGLICGMVFSKLMFLLLLKISKLNTPLTFIVEPRAIVLTVVLFACIFGVTMLYNMWQVFRVNTIELLHSKNQGEREPKTKWLMTIIGVVCIAAGYGIAIKVENPLEALFMFFVAVILVIIGTYALFAAGSIALLKAMRKNKNYYYKTNHFISVSGMIYRMKQNAAGLANICILSTMVLVMVSTTVSLYAGITNVLITRFPYEFNGETRDASEEDIKTFQDTVRQEAKARGLTVKTELVYQGADLLVLSQGKNKLSLAEPDPNQVSTFMSTAAVTVLPVSWYNSMNGDETELADGEAMVYLPQRNKSLDIAEGKLDFGGHKFEIIKELDEFMSSGKEAMLAMDTVYLIVADQEVVQTLVDEASKYQGDIVMSGSLGYNFEGGEKEKEDFTTWMNDRFSDSGFDGYVEIRENYREEFYTFYGGFLFLGIFFGSLFLMATVLIIYYKQISEGYEDKERFQIMQKVGMSKKEVRKSIRSQVVSVFALPLIVAVIHICAAFKLITRLLAVMNLSDVGLFRNCTILTVCIFALMYGIVYGITAREYYRIVN